MKDLQIYSTLGLVRYKDWHLRVAADDGGRMFLQWQFWATCADTGKREMQSCRKWWLSRHMTQSELVATAFKAALAAEEHECRENFTYAGLSIYGPHMDLRALMEAAKAKEVRS